MMLVDHYIEIWCYRAVSSCYEVSAWISANIFLECLVSTIERTQLLFLARSPPLFAHSNLPNHNE
jgi:hypothetical protein